MRLLYLLIIVLDALVILDLLRSTKDVEKKILWIIAVICLPVLGPVLYYLLKKR